MSLPTAQIAGPGSRRRRIIDATKRPLGLVALLVALHGYTSLRGDLLEAKRAAQLQELHEHIEHEDQAWATMDCLGSNPRSYCSSALR